MTSLRDIKMHVKCGSNGKVQAALFLKDSQLSLLQRAEKRSRIRTERKRSSFLADKRSLFRQLKSALTDAKVRHHNLRVEDITPPCDHKCINDEVEQ
jgi:hypothetical protein